MCMGDFLLSLGEDQTLRVWDIIDFDITGDASSKQGFREVNAMALAPRDLFQPTALIHPHTYLNKVLVGSKQVLKFFLSYSCLPGV